MARVDRIRQLVGRLLPEPAAPGPVPASVSTYDRIRALVLPYRAALAATNDLTAFEYRVFSQNGEDGVILEILQRVGTSSRHFVEFGIGEGREGNCVLLADAFGWSGLFMEADDDWFAELQAKYRANPRVCTVQALVTATNVNALLAGNGVPEELDVLSIDIDSHDYWVWEAVEGFRPRLVVIEYNAALDAEARLVKPLADVSGWDETDYYGASLGALRSLAETKGYTCVHTDLAGANAFFVRSDLIERVGQLTPPVRPPNFGLAGVRLPADPLRRPYTDLDAG